MLRSRSAARGRGRTERPLKTDEVLKRDKTELEMGTDAVMAAAKYTICNEETLDEFYRRLMEFVSFT